MNKSAVIADYLTVGTNSFGLLRVIAACAVVFSHSWTVTGGADVLEPLKAATGFTLGWHAVHLFFALSGLLIAGSLNHSRSIKHFIWSRFLRIFPGLMAVAVTTLVVAAIFVDTSDWQKSTVTLFLIKNLLLMGPSATLPGVFEGNPLPGEINIPLWTLKYEVFAYATIAALTIVCWRFSNYLKIKVIILAVLFVTAFLMLFFGPPHMHDKFNHVTRLIFAFYLGVAAWHWRDQLRASGLVLLVLTLANLALLWFEIHYVAMQIVWVAYAGLWVGTRTYGTLSRLTDRQDYSYGIYIIGYPVQQTVLAYGGVDDPWLNFAISITLTLALAACCWNLVEKPALRLKKLFVGRVAA